jgi:hypothetical protein
MTKLEATLAGDGPSFEEIRVALAESRFAGGAGTRSLDERFIHSNNS